jgi:hypothetical protein
MGYSPLAQVPIVAGGQLGGEQIVPMAAQIDHRKSRMTRTAP